MPEPTDVSGFVTAIMYETERAMREQLIAAIGYDPGDLPKEEQRRLLDEFFPIQEDDDA